MESNIDTGDVIFSGVIMGVVGLGLSAFTYGMYHDTYLLPKDNQDAYTQKSEELKIIFEKHYPDLEKAETEKNLDILTALKNAQNAIGCLKEFLNVEHTGNYETRPFIYNDEYVSGAYDLVSSYPEKDFSEIHISYKRTELYEELLISEINKTADQILIAARDPLIQNDRVLAPALIPLATQLKAIADRTKNEQQLIANNVLHHTHKTGSTDTPVGIVSDFQSCQAGIDSLLVYLSKP